MCKVWFEFKGNGGYGLVNLKVELVFVFDYYDVEEDVKVVVEVVLFVEECIGKDFLEFGCFKFKGVFVECWYEKVILFEGKVGGKFEGEVVCFFGKLIMLCSFVVYLVVEVGILVCGFIFRKVILLVVGD